MNTTKRTIVNFISFYDLAPYPLKYSASEWYQLPEWQRSQLEHDASNVTLSYNYIVESKDLNNNTITFRYDFKKSTLLPATPKDWVLPNSRFDISSDIYRVMYTIGESKLLFKFINESNNNKPSYKAFIERDISQFENYSISMDITLVKTNKTEFNNKTVTTEVGQVLSIPTIFKDYSDYIWHKANSLSGSHSSDYFQDIYFPMMLDLGYANYDKYEAYGEKFDKENNPGWDYITVKVSYIKDPKLVRDLSIKYLNFDPEGQN